MKRVREEEEEQGSGQSFRRSRKRSQADFATTRRRGGFAAPSISIQMGFPAGQGPLGLAAKARYEHLTRLVELYK